MAALLGRFGAWLAEWIIPVLVKDVVSAIKTWLDARARRKAIEEEAKKSVEPMKKAQTGKEIDDASHDAADGI